MARLPSIFANCAAQGRGALMPYVTAGDPSLAATAELLPAIAAAGADIIEVGLPFSDPLLDGPVIQASAQRAVSGGAHPTAVLDTLAGARAAISAGVILMTPSNLVLRLGWREFAEAARRAGVDGVLITDLPPEEGTAWHRAAAEAGLETVGLLAPTSTPERIRATAAVTTGFIYCISRRGVTGEQAAVADDLDETVGRIRAECDLPIAVGFGIATPEQVRCVARLADGVVVGSALVRVIHEHAGDPVPAARDFVAALRAGLVGA